MNSPLLAIAILEIVLFSVAYFGTSFVGALNREDKELATFRKILIVMFFIGGNLIVFFGE